MPVEFCGYHGTNAASCDGIIGAGFLLSAREDEWLGAGVYFFVEGIGNPALHAAEWAKNQAYCKETKTCKFPTYAVLEAKAIATRILDLTTHAGLNAFDELRSKIILKHNQFFARGRDFAKDDCTIWNLVSEAMDLDIAIHNLYIKNKTQRIRNIGSRVPNCTVMCVKKTECIEKTSIKIVDNGPT